jgi:hypothetical protein
MLLSITLGQQIQRYCHCEEDRREVAAAYALSYSDKGGPTIAIREYCVETYEC